MIMKKYHWMLAAALLLAPAGLSAQKASSAQAEPQSVRMVKSEMTRMPEAWMIDFSTVLKWNYCHGLELQSFMQVADQYPAYADQIQAYAKAYTDTIIDPEGQIRKYKLTNYTLDHVNPAKFIFQMYDRTGDPRFKSVLDTVYKQLTQQPRVSEGGFWHKKVYPNQMWLDGIYMEAPYYAQYAQRFLTGDEQQQAFDDVVRQFTVIARHTYDPHTGLYRHAWDESREQKWADPVTGQAPHVWGRALGWYCMAMVDVLDFLPADYAGRDSLLQILTPLCAQLVKIQDSESGAWYQVLDCLGQEGNYQETSCTAMFAYTFLKGVEKGYLPEEYWQYGMKAYNGLNKYFIREDADGTISLTRVCGVAGLGGTPYRSGSYDYYVHEIVRDNDPKGVGPYIMASLIVERHQQK
jgi:unsaturated rhamnogalacturonyl hydrolase